MSIERIVERRVERDEEKWTTEATLAIEADADLKAYLLEEPTDGPLTARDKQMLDVRSKVQKELANVMKRHYIDSIPAATGLMVFDIVMYVLDDFNWEHSADEFINHAVEKMPKPVAA